MTAIVTYYPETEASLPEAVGSVLSKLEQVAIGLWPAWLPGADRLDGPGGAGIAAARALAMEMAAATDHFGPFLADLAERSLRGAESGPPRFAAEVRASELAEIIAATFHRPHTTLLIHPPMDLAPEAANTLVDAYEWLAHHGGLSIWLIATEGTRFGLHSPVIENFGPNFRKGWRLCKNADA
jgi:hypothetical protein